MKYISNIAHLKPNEQAVIKERLKIVEFFEEFGEKASNQVLKEAKKLGFQKIYIEVRPENTRAINLYQKLGFKNLGLKKYPDNPNLPEARTMEKEI